MKTLTPTELLVSILNDHGMLSETTDLPVLAIHFPNVMVGVKMGASLRFALPAHEVQKELDKRMAACPEHEYVREAFLPRNEYDRLRDAFGIAKAVNAN